MNRLTHILMLILGFLLLLLILCLGGCAANKTSNVDVIWHSGGCLLIVDGLSATQADQIQSNWDFKDCEVSVVGDVD